MWPTLYPAHVKSLKRVTIDSYISCAHLQAKVASHADHQYRQLKNDSKAVGRNHRLSPKRTVLFEGRKG